MNSFKTHIEERARQSSRKSSKKDIDSSEKSSKKSKKTKKKLNIKNIMKNLAIAGGAGIVGGIAFKNFLKKNAHLLGDISIEFLKNR